MNRREFFRRTAGAIVVAPVVAAVAIEMIEAPSYFVKDAAFTVSDINAIWRDVYKGSIEKQFKYQASKMDRELEFALEEWT